MPSDCPKRHIVVGSRRCEEGPENVAAVPRHSPSEPSPVWGSRLAVLIAVALLTGVAVAAQDDGTSVAATPRGRETVEYQAWIQDDWIVVSARHRDGWHTYAMDNIERAREVTGAPEPETEMPTRLEVRGDPQPKERWRQSPPQDLSQPDIEWYTWGFEGTVYFARPIVEAPMSGTVLVSGQACTEEVCSRIDELPVAIREPDAETPLIDPEQLVPVE